MDCGFKLLGIKFPHRRFKTDESAATTPILASDCQESPEFRFEFSLEFKEI
jgi:hypothetical protein